MKIDILFWFYKEFDLCAERLQRLRRIDPDIQVFALYGGPLEFSDEAQKAVDPWINDFYAYPEVKDRRWKWRNGDQIIANWYENRGRNLKWDTIFIQQWDMLVFDSTANIFHDLHANEILLSSYRPLSEVQATWPWAHPRNENFIAFNKLLKDKFNYQEPLFACLFVVVCFPRIFLEKYLEIGHPEQGFLEYKIPTLSNMFNITPYTGNQFNAWWPAESEFENTPNHIRVLSAMRTEIPETIVREELNKRDGSRIFHPYFRAY